MVPRILAVAACASALLAPRPHLRPPSAVRVIETAPTTTAPVALPGAPERWKKATKQLATLGPASSTLAMLEKLFLAGVDVFRLNFSHGAHEEKAELVKLIRQVEAKYGHPIAILADLQGPKLRVGVFGQDKVLLSAGQKFRFDLDDEPGDADALPHHHGKLTTMTMTRRRCGGAHDNRRAWRRRGRRAPPGARACAGSAAGTCASPSKIYGMVRHFMVNH